MKNWLDTSMKKQWFINNKFLKDLKDSFPEKFKSLLRKGNKLLFE